MSKSGAPSKVCLYDKTHAIPTNAEHMMPNPPDLGSVPMVTQDSNACEPIPSAGFPMLFSS